MVNLRSRVQTTACLVLLCTPILSFTHLENTFCDSNMSAFEDLTIKSDDIKSRKFTESNLVKLKMKFPTYSNDTLARYLLARDDDLEKATAMFEEFLKNTADIGPILKEDIKKELDKGIMCLGGVDKEGRQILMMRARYHDSSNRDVEGMKKMALWFAHQAINKLPDHLSKYTILVDRTDTAKNSPDLEMPKVVGPIMQVQHPERLQRVIVYPSSLVFWGAWNVIKWFVDPVTRGKVAPMLQFSGVLEFIDIDNIPENMGGKMKLEYNIDDYDEIYTTEEVERIRAERVKAGKSETADSSTKTG